MPLATTMLLPLLILGPAPATPPSTRPAEDLGQTAQEVGRALQTFTGRDQLIVLAVAAVIIPVVVAMHYEAMRMLVRIASPVRHRPRASLILVILGLLVAHLLEVAVFGVVYMFITAAGHLGGLHTTGGEPLAPTGVDWFYFSAVVYSTVGFGDLVPFGPMRLLAGLESVLGLMLVTWSASFTYLQMHTGWRDAFEPDRDRGRAVDGDAKAQEGAKKC